MQILVIVPVTGLDDQYIEMRRVNLEKSKGSETHIDVVSLERGSASIDGAFDDVFATPEILRCIQQHHDQYDGFVIHCAADPGVDAARELTRKPVVGAGQASMCMATLVGTRFGVISPDGEAITSVYRRAWRLGYAQNLVSVTSLDIPVLDLYPHADITKAAFLEAARRLVSESQIDTVVPGCGAFSIWADEFTEQLGIPVMNPGACALTLVETLVRLRISHSRLAFATLAVKDRQIDAIEYSRGSM